MNKFIAFIAFVLISSFSIAQSNENGRVGNFVTKSAIKPLIKQQVPVFISDHDNGSLTKDQTINDDLIISGSLGVGFDCTSGMTFGFSTIVLRENNVSLLFDDSSETSEFPSNDWSLNANSTLSGGDDYFEIQDVTALTTPFKIMAAAPTGSLFVNSNGNIGVGTISPIVELHVKDNDTPTLRLDQDGTSGWAPQIWDIAGNETNFFIRDVTNGNAFPFKIYPNASTNSFVISSKGFIGLGMSNPIERLHVNGSAKVDSTMIFNPIVEIPVLPIEGEMYMDANDHMLKYYNGIAWNAVSCNTDCQNLVSATLYGTVLEVKIENGTSVSVDLEPILTDLEARVTYLEDQLTGGSIYAKYSNARLFQNVPNPYKDATVIPYFIPDNIENASISIVDINGITIEKYMIYERGNGSFEIDSMGLKIGTYFYTLNVDGKKLESKTLVKID